MTHETGGDLCTVPCKMVGLEAMEAETPLLDLSNSIVGMEAYEDGTAFGRMDSLAHAASGRRFRVGLLRFVDRFAVERSRRVGGRARSLKDRRPFGDGVDELLKPEYAAFSFRFEFLLNQDMRHMSQSLVNNVHD